MYEYSIRNHYVMPSVELKRSHGRNLRIFRIVQKRIADDELEFTRVPYSDPKQKLVTVIEAGGGGGGNLPASSNIQ